MKIAVVGAGPIGSLLSLRLLQKNKEVVVFEEDEEPGIPAHCAGVVSLKTLRIYDLSFSQRFILNRFRGAYIFLPGGHVLHVARREYVACVIDRVSFDRELSFLAEKKGAALMLGTRVEDLLLNRSKVLVKTGKRDFCVDKVYLCEGLSRTLTKKLASLKHRPLVGVNIDLEASISFPEDHVCVFISKKVSDRLFAWLIPLNGGLVRLGLAASSNVAKRLSYVIKYATAKGLIDSLRKISESAGLVNVDGPLPRFSFLGDRVIVVGDAAGQNKPTTGGGLYYGGLGALLASQTTSGRDYEKAWWSVCGRDIKFMSIFRRVLDNLSDRDLEEMLKRIDLEELSQLFSFRADFDRQSLVMRSLMDYLARQPLGSLLLILKSLIVSLLA